MIDMNMSFEGFKNINGRFNISKLLDELQKQLGDFFEQAYRRFIKGVVDAFGDNTPTSGVETGMTLGSIAPLASRVKAQEIITRRLLSDQKRKAKAGYGGQGGGVKSFSQGLRLGKGAYKLHLGTVDEGIFELEFNITVFQHELWEGQWQTLEAGVKAFDDYVQKNINTAFDIDKILLKLI